MSVEISFAGCANCYVDVMKEEASNFVNAPIEFRVDLTKTRHDSRVLHHPTCEFINRESQKLHHIEPPVETQSENYESGLFGR